MLSKLDQRHLALDGGKRHLRLEGLCGSGAVVLSTSLLFAAHSVPAVSQKLYLSSYANFRGRPIDYVQTTIDLATIEGASGAARCAMNGVLRVDGSTSECCKLFPFQESATLEAPKRMT
jgi:hypothetical protein